MQDDLGEEVMAVPIIPPHVWLSSSWSAGPGGWVNTPNGRVPRNLIGRASAEQRADLPAMGTAKA
eukprot:12988520-Alexandrium_andersonii.AAC.1